MTDKLEDEMVVQTDDGCVLYCRIVLLGPERQRRWFVRQEMGPEHVGPPDARTFMEITMKDLINDWWETTKAMGHSWRGPRSRG